MKTVVEKGAVTNDWSDRLRRVEVRMDVQRICTYIAPFTNSHPCGIFIRMGRWDSRLTC